MCYQEIEQHSNGTLRTYVTLKKNHTPNFGREHYLTIVNNFDQRKSIAKLRIPAHQLNIYWKGRYTGLLPDLRICSQCNLMEVEDELHFLLFCSKQNSERLQRLGSI